MTGPALQLFPEHAQLLVVEWDFSVHLRLLLSVWFACSVAGSIFKLSHSKLSGLVVDALVPCRAT